MGTQVQALVDRLWTAGEWPDPQLLEDIAAQGEAVIEPLVAYVRRDEHEWPEDYHYGPLDFALYLLGRLHATSALPDILNLYRLYDDDILDLWLRHLQDFGPELIEPGLDIVRDRSLNWYQRAMGSELAHIGAKNDPDLRARLALALRDILDDYIAQADQLTDEDFTAIGALVNDLVSLGYTEARPSMERAYEMDIVDESIIGREDLDEAFQEGSQPFRPRQSDWLAQYRQDYERRQAEVQHQQSITRYSELLGEPRSLPVRAGPKLGRNDPCWCGSGKKYKNCHMRQDEAEERGRGK